MSFLEQYIHHDYVNVKDLWNELYSINFNRKAFSKWVWDNITTHARWLFVWPNGEVYARSYNKFFNLWEREETLYENLWETVWFPMFAYSKYNGFLWIVGYKDGEVLYCSKSTNEWPFAEMVKKHLSPYENRIKEVVSQWYTMVFEILDENDVHIVYEEEWFQPILLDIIKNDLYNFEKLPYEELWEIWAHIWLPVKMFDWKINNYSELETFLETHNDSHWEWFVLEWPNGMVKIKTPHYRFWKEVRASLSKFVSEIKKALIEEHTDELSVDFITRLSSTSKEKEVVDFLNLYYKKLNLDYFEEIVKHIDTIRLFQSHNIDIFWMNIPDIAKIWEDIGIKNIYLL